jgi:GNAT superfamily N-acetyltransferase
MEISIRILTTEDAEAFRNLRLKSYQEDPFSFSESFEDERTKPLTKFIEEVTPQGHPLEWFVLGAFAESGQLIGFVKFRRDKRSKARHKSMLHAMYVDTKFRKQGIGEKLIVHLLDRVKKLEGLEQIHLWVLRHEGISASNFYKKCGFENLDFVVKKDLKINDQYIDAEYMVMYLDS